MMQEYNESLHKKLLQTEEDLFRERLNKARAAGRLSAIIDHIEKLPLDDTITYLKETLKELEGEKK